MNDVRHVNVLVVGSGGNGMSTAVKLLEAGFDDLAIITKHKDFGGTWYQNAYPGCAVNDEFVSYQFGYALTSDWAHHYPTQPELVAYMQTVAADYDLYSYADFETEMLEAQWLQDDACWSVSTTRGTYRANVLVLATGFLEKPRLPEIQGMDAFEGRLFHSAMWPSDYTGEADRIAVVGTGASALQIVPEMQKTADKVILFQRTPCWIEPLGQRAIDDDERTGYRTSPERFMRLRAEAFQRGENMWEGGVASDDPIMVAECEDIARRWLEKEISDPELRRALTPNYRWGCKVPGMSDDFYQSLLNVNVELVAAAAAGVGAKCITSADGREFEVDTIIFATGFVYGTHFLNCVRRRDGQTVAEAQQGHPRAYKSISVSGCPNLFLIGGPAPNGQIWNGLSAAGEIGGGYIVKALEYMNENGVRAMEVDEAAESAWKQKTDECLDAGVLIAGGCINDERDATGHNQASWPGTEAHMAATLSRFDADMYTVIAHADRVTP